MPDFSATLSIVYGDATPAGSNVPQRRALTFEFAYTEESCKTVAVPASTTDFPVDLDTVSAPKMLLIRSRDVDVTITLVNGADDVPTSLAATNGWVMFCNPNGQPVNALTITTPASPASGARVEILAFE